MTEHGLCASHQDKKKPTGWVGGVSRKGWASNVKAQPTGSLTFGRM